MTLTSWFSSMPSSRRSISRTGAHRSGARSFRRRATIDALENRLVMSTVQFTTAAETVNQTTGSFAVGVSLSSPPAGTPVVSNYAAISTSGGIAADAAGNVFVADFVGNKVNEITPAGVVTTFAAGLLGPEQMVFGPNGDLDIAENFDGVDQVTPTGQITDIANGSMFDDPRGIAADGSGNLYVSNYSNGTVVKVTPAGVVSAYASGFNHPDALAIDASGDLFVADFNLGVDTQGSVIEVLPTGVQKTVASGLPGPTGLAVDAAGNLYVGNSLNFPSSVTKVTPAGVVSTFLSGEFDLNSGALCFDGAGNLYMGGYTGPETAPTDEVLKVTQTVTASFSLGGSAASGLAYSGVTASPLTFGIGITSLNITGTLLPDAGTDQTLTFTLGTPTGGASLGSPIVNTMTINEPVVVQFGTGSETVSESDGTFSIPVTVSNTPTETASVPFSLSGPAISGVTFSGVTASPLTFGVGQTTVDITGTLLTDPGPSQTLTITLGTSATGAVVGPQSSNTLTITEPARVQFDTGSETVNESAGTFSIPVTVSGTPTVSTFASGFDQPYSLAVDSAGNLYVPNGLDDTVSKVTPAGAVNTFASGFDGAIGVAFDAAGNLYVSNGLDNTVSKVTPAGIVSQFASGFNGPAGLAFDPAGNLYVANTTDGTVSKVTPAGVVTAFASGLIQPYGVAFHAGNLYVANSETGTVSEVTPAGKVSTFASGFLTPVGLAFDAASNLYVADQSNNSVSQVAPAGVVTTLVSGFDEPSGLALAAGNLYVVNTNSDIAGAPSTISVVSQIIAAPFTLGGSATSGVDFSGVTASPLLFGLGQTTLDITGKLLDDPGPGRALTFTLGTPVGNAALGSPSENTLTINESATGSPTPTPTPTTTAPLFLGEQRVFSGKGKHKTLKGFEFLFNGALNAGSAQTTGNYHVTQKHGKKPKVLRVKSALYNPSAFSITISVAGFKTSKPAQVTIAGLAGANGDAVPEIISGL